MKSNVIYLGVAIIMAIIAGASISCAYKARHLPPKVQTDTLYVYDTIRTLEPVEVAYIPQGYELTPIGLVSDLQAKIGDLVSLADSLEQSKPTIIVRDSLVFIQVPMEQKIYQGENYKAAVSGYKPNLDWIETYNATKTITPKPKKWGLSISAGYGITPEGFEPILMIGISRDIIQW